MNSQTRSSLRKSLRQARRQLSPKQQDQAAIQLHHRISSQRFFRKAKRIAFYLPSDGEIDPSLLLADALMRGQQCYLPSIHPFRPDRLIFLRYRHGEPLLPHRWGLWQPALRHGALVQARALDLVFVPLVGFDKACNRLGMGKGFYDKSFSFRTRTGRHRPKLIGLAHECQRVESLETRTWDVRMDKIVTDCGTYQP
jgi:5-formyltetrahydrofolate cyclo-ligase